MWDDPEFTKRALIELLRRNRIPVTLDVASALIYLGVEMLSFGDIEPENIEYIFYRSLKDAVQTGAWN